MFIARRCDSTVYSVLRLRVGKDDRRQLEPRGPPGGAGSAVVEYEEARELADAASVEGDLGFVEEVLSRLVELLREQGEQVDHVLVEAYWTGVLVGTSLA